jgi:hypothetical protein
MEISAVKAAKIAPKIDFLKNGPWGQNSTEFVSAMRTPQRVGF